jgi:hypothetical protein
MSPTGANPTATRLSGHRRLMAPGVRIAIFGQRVRPLTHAPAIAWPQPRRAEGIRGSMTAAGSNPRSGFPRRHERIFSGLRSVRPRPDGGLSARREAKRPRKHAVLAVERPSDPHGGRNDVDLKGHARRDAFVGTGPYRGMNPLVVAGEVARIDARSVGWRRWTP